jgi:hypothetical protein
MPGVAGQPVTDVVTHTTALCRDAVALMSQYVGSQTEADSRRKIGAYA